MKYVNIPVLLVIIKYVYLMLLKHILNILTTTTPENTFLFYKRYYVSSDKIVTT